MIWYFAYGSNMLRERLQERVGGPAAVCAARVDGYEHSFTKLGRDGTGKGNILPAPDRAVYGILYRISRDQLDGLCRYEGGYERFSLSAAITRVLASSAPGSHDDRSVMAQSFRAIRPVPPLRPTREYVEFYERSMRDNRLPEEYCAFVLSQARALWDE